MKPLSAFYPLVLPSVIGAPEPLVDQSLRLACRDFCQRTSAWVEWQDVLSANPVTNLYEFDVPADQELVRVARAMVDGVEFDVLSYRDVPPDWINPSTTSLHNKLVHFEGSEFLVYPNSAQSIRLQLAFKPTLSAASVGDDLFNKWGEDIAAGAKASLMLTRGQPYFDPAMASIYKQSFESAIHKAANVGFQQRSPGSRVVKKASL